MRGEGSSELRPLWRGLPSDLVGILQSLVLEFDQQESYGEAVRQIAEDARARGHELDEATSANVLIGVRVAVRCFLAELDPDGVQPDRSLFVAHGRAQHDAGRSLEELLGFYTAGALVMWSRVLAHGLALALTSEQLGAMAAAVFAFIHDLSAFAAEGYSQARQESTGTRETRRERLLQMLLGEPAQPLSRVESAARLAGYRLPERLAVMIAAGDHVERLRVAVGASLLVGLAEEVACVVIPVTDSFEWQLARALEGLPADSRAGLGEAVAWRSTRLSLRSAIAAAALPAVGSEQARFVRAEEVPVAMLLAGDAHLAASIRRRYLQPLEEAPSSARTRLAETLQAWLQTPGQPQAVARQLGVHVQTVRYRMRQLHELFDGRLDDPEERFRLAVALRVPDEQERRPFGHAASEPG